MQFKEKIYNYFLISPTRKGEGFSGVTILRYIDLLRREKIKFSKVYLFGSYAKGKDNPDSDIDLAIILDKKKIDRFKERLILMKLRWDVDLRIEPHPFSREDLDETNPLIKEITTTGKKIV